MKIHLKFNHFLKKGVLLLGLPLLLLMSCKGEDYEQETGFIDVKRVGGVTVDQDSEMLAMLFPGLQVSDELDIAYGVDLRSERAYQLSLITGDVQFLAPQGRGPGELARPAQIYMKDDTHLFIYDSNMNTIAEYNNGSILNKYPAYSQHNVWVRGYTGYYHNGTIIIGIDDYTNVQNMDFDNVKPIAFLDFSNEQLTKKGEFSPTVDQIDADEKFPVIHFDENLRTVFYVFSTDYTVMGYHIDENNTMIKSSYKPTDVRIRSVEIRGSTFGDIEAAKALGLDRSKVIGIDRIGDQLVVIWQNFNEGFYDNMGDYSAGNVDYFGVMYDLPNLENPREFTLPGRFFGTYKNKLLIEEEYGSMDLKIGFYELKHTGESSP
ncbi:MAG: hypothetical protein EA391_14360 [Balneolaceae bacterium]|nr:MAG: hypothetical protein EA391_14360 [Balneolaceae bacterium]